MYITRKIGQKSNRSGDVRGLQDIPATTFAAGVTGARGTYVQKFGIDFSGMDHSRANPATTFLTTDADPEC